MSTPDPKDLKAVSWAKHIKQLPFGQTDSTVDLNWAELSLTYDAVMGNSGPVMSGRKEGIADFTETCSRVQELVEKYGGRAIELRKDGASWALDGGYVQVSAWRDIVIRFASIDKNFSEEVNKIMDSLGTVPPTGTVYVLTASDSGLSFTPMGLSGQKIIAENYSPLERYNDYDECPSCHKEMKRSFPCMKSFMGLWSRKLLVGFMLITILMI